MSRKGNRWNNAMAESFLATVKKELILRFTFAIRCEAVAVKFEYIEVFCNRVRKIRSRTNRSTKTSDYSLG